MDCMRMFQAKIPFAFFWSHFPNPLKSDFYTVRTPLELAYTALAPITSSSAKISKETRLPAELLFLEAIFPLLFRRRRKWEMWVALLYSNHQTSAARPQQKSLKKFRNNAESRVYYSASEFKGPAIEVSFRYSALKAEMVQSDRYNNRIPL